MRKTALFKPFKNQSIECEMVEEFKPFESIFTPEDMRCLALVAHNHLKPAMKAFVEERRELLKKFRLTG